MARAKEQAMNSWHRTWWAAAVVVAVAVFSVAAWFRHEPQLDGLASGNGRIEADEVGIATKSAGRVQKILVEEGDLVQPGQTLAQMDTAEIEAELREADARAREAIEQRDVAVAVITQRKSECDLAEKELQRSSTLYEERVNAESDVDVKRARFETAQAACEAAEAQRVDAEASIEAAYARVARIKIRLDDAALTSPVMGRVLYQHAEESEVLGAGGRLLTLVDLNDVYMEIFLSSREAARVEIGAEARLVLDALPEFVIPATVSFVAPEAQFTPKQVETASERDKLMFRVKVRVPREITEPHIEMVKTGIRGVAYVRLAGTTAEAWPARLAVQLPPSEAGS